MAIDPIRDGSGALVGCAKITPDRTEPQEAGAGVPHHRLTSTRKAQVEKAEALVCIMGEVEASGLDSTVGKNLAAGP